MIIGAPVLMVLFCHLDTHYLHMYALVYYETVICINQQQYKYLGTLHMLRYMSMSMAPGIAPQPP
jgi:hypothetical protein